MTDPIDLLRDLVAVDSVNPDLVPGGAGEGAVARLCADWLRKRGFSVDLVETRPGRPSVVATAGGTGGGRSIMLNGHLDTVALSSYEGDGLEPVLRDGCLYGRGTYDMKSGIAAMMLAAAAVAQEPHRGDIVLALVADEENASFGTEDVLAAGHRTDGAIVAEPSGLDLVVAHRGFVWAADPAFRFELRLTADREPFAAQADSAVAALVDDACSQLLGAPPTRRGEPFWTDCALLAEAGVDVVLIGVDGGGAHAATEWVDLSSYTTLVEVLTKVVREYTA